MKIAEGIESVRILLLKVNRPIALFIYASLLAYVFYEPITLAYHNLQDPPMGEDIKPVVSYLHANYSVADQTYVYYGALPAFKFYASSYGLDDNSFIAGIAARSDPTKYFQNLDGLRGNQHVWFVFAHNCSWCIVNEERAILEHLDKIGIRRDEFISSGAHYSLYHGWQIEGSLGQRADVQEVLDLETLTQRILEARATPPDKP